MGLFSSLFGPSKKEIWSQIAYDIGGRYKDGGFWSRDHISYYHDEWEIVLDTYKRKQGNHSQTYTRMRAPFANRDGLYFKIYRKGFFSGVSKFFGMQDIEIGDEYFDKDFIIKGNSDYQIRKLLEGDDMKGLIERQHQVHFEIRDDEGIFRQTFPDGVDQLYFQSRGVMKDEEQIRDLFDLFSLTLERLVEIDSAYPDGPTDGPNITIT